MNNNNNNNNNNDLFNNANYKEKENLKNYNNLIVSETDRIRVISEYERILLKQKKCFDKVFFVKATPQIQKENFLIIFKYWIENIMHWTPEDAGHYMTLELTEMFCLKGVLRYIEIPKIMKGSETRYILHLIYPKLYKYNEKQEVINIYKRSLEKKNNLPNNFFAGMQGKDRGILCLTYYLNNKYLINNIEDLYAEFNQPKILVTLRNSNLLSCATEHFKSPLHFLHNSLPVTQKNFFLFKFHQFMAENKEVLKFFSNKYVSNQ